MGKVGELYIERYGTTGCICGTSVELLQNMYDEIEATAINLNKLGKMDEDLAVKVETELMVLRRTIEKKRGNNE